MWDYKFTIDRIDIQEIRQELFDLLEKRLPIDRIKPWFGFYPQDIALLERYNDEIYQDDHKGDKRAGIAIKLSPSGDPQTIISVKIFDRPRNRSTPQLNYDRGFPQNKIIEIINSFEKQWTEPGVEEKRPESPRQKGDPPGRPRKAADEWAREQHYIYGKKIDDIIEEWMKRAKVEEPDRRLVNPRNSLRGILKRKPQ